jgi:hypothetical protein
MIPNYMYPESTPSRLDPKKLKGYRRSSPKVAALHPVNTAVGKKPNSSIC